MTDARKKTPAPGFDFESLLENVSDAVVVFDTQWRYLYCNAAHERLFKKPRRELLGKTLAECFPESVGTLFDQQFRQALAEQTPVTVEGFYPPLNFWVEARVHPTPHTVTIILKDITQRKVAELALQNSEMHFRKIYEGAPLGIVLVQASDYRILEANDAFCRMLGYTEWELKHLHIADITHPDDVVLSHENLERVLLGANPDPSLVKRYRKKNGDTLHVRLHIAPLRPESGAIQYTYGIVEDITASHSAQDQLAQSEARFAALASTAVEAVVISEQGRVVDVNDQATQLFGYTRDEIIGLDIQQFVVPEDRDRIMPYVREGRDMAEEHRIMRKDGSILMVETRARMISYQNRIVRVAAIRDITDHKKALEALRDSESRFHKVFNEAFLGMTIVNSQTHQLLEVNAAMCRILGYSAEELTRLRFDDFTHPEDRAASADNVDRLAHREYTAREWTKRYLKKDGSIIYAVVRVSALPTEPGQPHLHLGMIEDITQRKLAEDALLQQEERLSLAQEAGGIGVFEIDLTTNRGFCTPEAEKLYGLPPGSFAADTLIWRNFVHPDDRPRVLAMVDHAKEHRADGQTEFRIIRPDGSVRWLNNIWRIYPDKLGQPNRVVGINMDITPRKQAEEALRQSEENFHSLVEFIPDGILVTSGFQVVYANPFAAHLLGAARPDDLVGKSMCDLVPPDRLPIVQRDFDRFAVSADPVTLHEGAFLRLDGSRLDVEVNLSNFQREGKPAGLVMFRDITERKKAEEALRQQDEQLVAAHDITRALIDNAPGSMVIVDREGIILECNLPLASRFGLKLDQLRGTNLFEHFAPPEFARARRACFERVLATGQPLEFEDSRTGHDYHASLFPLRNPDGSVHAVAFHFSDITERNQARENLLQHQARLRQMASELSLTQARERRELAQYVHDGISQDLAAARLQLKMLNALTLPPDSSDLVVKTQDLITRAIDHTRFVTFGLSPPALFELGLASAVKGLVEELQKLHDIKIDLRIPNNKRRYLAEGPRVLVYRAIRELLMNVVKHAQAGHVTLTLEKKPACYAVTVTDDGIGFVPTPASIRNTFGLFSIREQIESLGGTVDIQSQPGRGTTVILTLPPKPVEPPTLEDHHDENPHPAR